MSERQHDYLTFPLVVPDGTGGHYPMVSAKPIEHDISSRRLTNRIARRILGFNSTIGGSLEDLVETGDVILQLPSVATVVDILSSSVNDTSAGTGARTIDVFGLDSNYVEQVETVTMNGTTTVTTTAEFLRFNNMHVITVGSGAVAAGTISARHTGLSAMYSCISAGGNMTLQAHYTIPASTVGYITAWGASGGLDKKVVRFHLRATVDWDDRSLIGAYTFQDILVETGGYARREFHLPIKLPAKCDLKVSGLNLDVGTAEGACSIELWQET